MSDATAPEPPRRGPSVLLIVSLALNAALIGLIAIWWLRMPPPREHGGGLSPPALARMVPAERDKIEAVMDRHRPVFRELRQRAMQARSELFGVMSAKDFDRAAFDKAMAKMQSADAALETETMKATAESMELLTPEERESVAREVPKPRGWLKRMFRHRR